MLVTGAYLQALTNSILIFLLLYAPTTSSRTNRHDLKNIKLDDVFEHAGIAAQLSYGDMKMLRSVPQDATHPFQKLSADEGPQGPVRRNADNHQYDSFNAGSAVLDQTTATR